ncbi:putative sporulation protein YtxC [Clostridium sediminicola]|uniref:putative sporulation protein YtxC n=1 Tax=Clostridium sediminicola TaxID=3114879 RepID=UPI0031F23967
MILLTVIYSDEKYDITEKLNKMQSYFSKHEVLLGFSESINMNHHFIEIYSLNPNLTCSAKKNICRYIASYIFQLYVENFCKGDFFGIIEDTYFFLKGEEIKKVEINFKKILTKDKEVYKDEVLGCINIKNDAIEKIVQCMMEKNEINIEGYYTFRKRDLKTDMEEILNKIVEQFMIQKEYDEFIKLLKYFVNIQESKIELIEIIINDKGDYSIRNANGESIIEEMIQDINGSNYEGNVGIEDLIISGLITYCPEKINIYGKENCKNNEMVETIKNVFEDKVYFCDTREIEKVKSPLHV